MTPIDQREIEERMRALDDRALLRFVAIEASQHHQPSEPLDVGLEVARDELQRRGLQILSTEQYYRRFEEERKSWRKSARKLGVDLLWAVAAIGGLALPALVLYMAMEKKWLSNAEFNRITWLGGTAFWLAIVFPAIQKARSTHWSKGDLLGKETVLTCVGLGFVASLLLIARIIYFCAHLR